MSAPTAEPTTTHLLFWIEEIRRGNLQARDELLRAVESRLRELACRMFKHYPKVIRWSEVEDMLQGATLRLLSALEDVVPQSRDEFYGLASLQMRRELIDLARHYNRKSGPENNHESDFQNIAQNAASGANGSNLERWIRFHELVEKLPEHERNIVELLFYHGFTQAEVATKLGVDVRTVQRHWDVARERLRRIVLGEDGDGKPGRDPS
jgi:RNA polymerase sigma-70 factor (ECF subfamily)